MSSSRVRTVSWSANSTTIPILNPDNAQPIKKSLLRPPKTTQEKILCYSLCFLFILMMVFLAALCIISERWKATLSKLTYTYMNEDVVCHTEACEETAQKLISNLDPYTDPCEDFYQYACGGWMEKNPIPKGREVFMVYDLRQAEISEIVVDLLNEIKPNQSTSRAVESLGKLYRGCLDVETRNSVGLQPLIKLLKDMGGWPMVEGDRWDGKQYSWYSHAAEANRKLLLDVFIELTFTSNLEDNKLYMIYMQRGNLLFDHYYELMNDSSSNKTLKLYNSIAEQARLLGSETEMETLREDAKKLVLFEYGLYLNGLSADDFGIYETTIEFLEENTTNVVERDSSFTYKEFINLHLKSEVPANDDTGIYLKNAKYFDELPSYIESVDLRIVANYISYWIANTFSAYTMEEFWILNSKTNWTSPRICRKISRSFMVNALGRLYIDKYFPTLTRYHVKKMVEMIRLAYSSTLDQNTWMDKETLLYSLVKSMESMTGYPEWIADDKLLDKFYEKLLDIEEGDYFGAIVQLCIIMGDDKYRMWNNTAQRNDTTEESVVTVNAFYIPRANFMVLPAGILGYPYYKFNRIDSVNYGGIGTVIGHEISHAFDIHGRLFDHEGNYRDWWPKVTKDKFITKAECFEEQYEGYVEEDDPLKVDGKLTLGENIADNGAVRNAFKAFRLHLALSDEDMTHRKTLPGLPATPEQLFFLGYASIWCANMTDDYARGFKDLDVHSPNKLRVNIPLANFKEFARAFKCNPGTRMNPKNKCVLW